MMVAAATTGLLSHKCDAVSEAFGERLRLALAAHHIDLQIDPFDPGDIVARRIETLKLDFVVFLVTPESVVSRWCRLELAAARNPGLPVFNVRLNGAVPVRCGRRISQSFPADDQGFELETARLASAIGTAVPLLRNLRLLATQWSDE